MSETVMEEFLAELAAATEQLKCFQLELKVANRSAATRKRIEVKDGRPQVIEVPECACCVCVAHRFAE